MASSVSTLMLKPKMYMMKKAPMSETGMSIRGRRRNYPVAEEQVNDEHHQPDGNKKRLGYFTDGAAHKT